MARGKRAPRMIVDWDQCIRVPDEDRRVARVSHPYKCAVCEDEGSYSGVLVFDGDNTPVCREVHDSLSEHDSLPVMVPC